MTSKVGSGATPRGGKAVYTNDGPAFIRSQNVLDNAMKLDGVARITHEAAQQLRGVIVLEGDVLLNITGDSIARTCVVDPAALPARVSQHVAIIRPSEELDGRFLQRYLVQPSTKEHLLSISDGGTRKALTKAHIEKLMIPVPPIEVQRGIAEVLGALDDKIAANAGLAATADELARSWFAALTSTATSLMTVGTLAEHPRVLAEPDDVDPATTYVGLEHVPRRHMWLDNSGTAETVTSTKAAFMEGDVLFGKLRPYFHKVVSAPVAGICSTDIMVVRAREASLQGFLLAAVSSERTVERCTAASEGTRMPRTSWKDLAAVEVPWPGEAPALTLSARIVELRKRIDSGYRESACLAETRDALLPLLMTGKIKVKDAERVVEGAV